MIVPKTRFEKTYANLKYDDKSVSFSVGDRTFVLDSKFSTPDGKWTTGDNRFFHHRREVTGHDEWILVRDTFTNQTDENLPLMQHHRSPVGGEATEVRLAGAKMPTKSGKHTSGANPSAFAATKDSGIGLVAMNDEFRVHATMIADDGSITLFDPSFVLAPGATYTAEFAIVPVKEPDFYAFVNAARRMLDVNFKLDVCFAFMFHKTPVYEWSDAKFTRFIENKSANFVVKSNYGVRTKEGHPARVTDWIAGPHTVYRDFHKRGAEVLSRPVGQDGHLLPLLSRHARAEQGAVRVGPGVRRGGQADRLWNRTQQLHEPLRADAGERTLGGRRSPRSSTSSWTTSVSTASSGTSFPGRPPRSSTTTSTVARPISIRRRTGFAASKGACAS